MIVAQCVQLFVTPWTVACQAPLTVGLLQTRILAWAALGFSRGSSRPRDQTQSPALQAESLPSEPPGQPLANEYTLWSHMSWDALRWETFTLPTSGLFPPTQKPHSGELWGYSHFSLMSCKYRKNRHRYEKQTCGYWGQGQERCGVLRFIIIKIYKYIT